MTSKVDKRDDAERLQALVLGRILELQPTNLNLVELQRDLSSGSAVEAETGEIEAAVRDLREAELLDPGDDRSLAPTYAAVRLGELLGTN